MTSHERPTERGASPDLAVSVVVPVFDGARVIEGCLEALDAQTLDPARYEVVVVDDGSTDDTRDRVRAVAASARCSINLVEQPENRGPAAARNAGIRVARAPLIAFTDADCRATPDWLARALDRLRDPTVAAVEGRVEPAGQAGTLTHQMQNQTGGQFMTANMVYRRDALAAAGGFDERFRLAYLEDTDVALTLLEAGARIEWAPEVLVEHLVLPEGRRKFWRDARKHFFNPLVYAKHPHGYVERLRPFRPAFPFVYVSFMGAAVQVVAGAIVAATLHLYLGIGIMLAASVPFARGWWRIAYIHRARDPVSFLQAGVYPFVHTFWVLAGAVRFRSFSTKL